MAQRVIEFLEEDFSPFVPDEVERAFFELGLEGDPKAVSGEVLEEGVRRAMEAVRGLRETFGELPYPESVLEERLREGGWFSVTLSNPHFMKSLAGRMDLGYENSGPIESSVFSVEDSDGRFPYKKEGAWENYKVPHFDEGIHGLPHAHRRRTGHVGMRYNRRVAREATSMRVGKLKAKLRTSQAVPASKAWGVSRASLGPGSCPNRAVGVGRPELKPLEKAVAFAEGGSPPL